MALLSYYQYRYFNLVTDRINRFSPQQIANQAVPVRPHDQHIDMMRYNEVFQFSGRISVGQLDLHRYSGRTKFIRNFH